MRHRLTKNKLSKPFKKHEKLAFRENVKITLKLYGCTTLEGVFHRNGPFPMHVGLGSTIPHARHLRDLANLGERQRARE